MFDRLRRILEAIRHAVVLVLQAFAGPSLEQRLRNLLAAIEPDLDAARALGQGREEEVLRVLDTFLDGKDRALAARAVYFGAHIGGPQATPLVSKAARSDDALRVVAASLLDLVSVSEAEHMAGFLVGDSRDDVAFHTVRAVKRMGRSELASFLASVAEHHGAIHVRAEARSGIPSA